MTLRRLAPSQRTARQILRRVRPFRQRVELAELDARWICEALHAAEPKPLRLVFRPEVDGARALAAVRGIPFAGECLRRAGIKEDSTSAEVVTLTLARFATAIARLREQGVDVVAYVDGHEVTFSCALLLTAGVPLEELVA